MEGQTTTHICHGTFAQRSSLINQDSRKNMPIFNSNVYEGKEARDMLRRGADIVANAVKVTLGSRGSNAILQEDLHPYHVITNDGVSIAEKVFSTHPVEAIGVNLMKEVAHKANKESGDGTTTATTLTQAILSEGFDSGQKGMEVMRSLNECLPIIYASIDSQKKEISVDEVAAAATISAEDPKLGAILQEIYQKIGKDGIIEIEPSGTFETTYEATEGVRLRNARYLSDYMANEGTKAIYRNPRILICKSRIATLADIDPLFGQLSSKGINELVMFVDDIDPQVAAALAFTHQKAIFKTLIIKAPTLWKDWLFADFAAITGATIVEPASGVTFKNLSPEHLGTCEKLTATREDTIVVGIKDISQHVKNLEEQGTDDSKLRLSWLKTKAATLRIGANSESEMSYKLRKAEDARNASYLALQGGIVPGGGVALLNASNAMPDTIGGNILRKALKAPIFQIMKNAGVEKDTFLTSDYGISKGFDSESRSIVDMWEKGIVDPAQVVKNAVKNAISVAGTILTAETITVKQKV